jgi:16S rRNA (guanine966-N2)-methyltransferase
VAGDPRAGLTGREGVRITGGRFRGRALAVPPGAATRPTSDRARQAIFNILDHAAFAGGVADRQVLDLFAGSGALGLEALSRGAAGAVLVESDRAALVALRANAAPFGPAARVLAADAARLPRAPGPAADLVFVDPPYGSGLGEAALARAAALGWIAADALIVFERGRGEPAPQGLIVADDRAYGAARVWFCRAPPA